MKTETELLPCPFCGTKPRITGIYFECDNPYPKLAIVCDDCDEVKKVVSMDYRKYREGTKEQSEAILTTDAIEAWNRRAPAALPAPQPGGGGEAEGVPCPECNGTGSIGKVWYYLNKQTGEVTYPEPSYTPPIALLVRAEAGTPRVDAMKFWALTSGIIRGSIEVVKVEDAKTLERELNRQSDIAEKQLHKAASLETQAAALSRELEEAKEELEVTKVALRAAGANCGRLERERNEVAAELKRSKAHRQEQRHRLAVLEPEVPKLRAELTALRAELTALRAAPRSEGLLDWLDSQSVKINGWEYYGKIPKEQRPSKTFREFLVKFAPAEVLTPRSETEGRDREALRLAQEALTSDLLWAFGADCPISARFEYRPPTGAFEHGPNNCRAFYNARDRALKAITAALAHDEKGVGE